MQAEIWSSLLWSVFEFKSTFTKFLEQILFVHFHPIFSAPYIAYVCDVLGQAFVGNVGEEHLLRITDSLFGPDNGANLKRGTHLHSAYRSPHTIPSAVIRVP